MPRAWRREAGSPAEWSSARNVDADAVDPGLRREHVRLLTADPLLQHVPYRDNQIGVSLTGVDDGGRVVLRVSFLGAHSEAEHDFARLLARLHDSGADYDERYLRLAP